MYSKRRWPPVHAVGNPLFFLDFGVVELDVSGRIDLQRLHRGHVALALDQHAQRHRIPDCNLSRLGFDAELEAPHRAGEFLGAALLGQRQHLYLQFFTLQEHRARAAKKRIASKEIVKHAAATRTLLGKVARNGQRADGVNPRTSGKKGHAAQWRDVIGHAFAHLLMRI